MTFTVIPVSEARRVTRVLLVDRDKGRIYEILEPEGAPVRAHPPMDLHGSSLADAATLQVAVERILENSTRAQADWNEQSDFEDIAEAATEADRLLAPSEVVPRDLDEDERQWRSDVTLRQGEIRVRARALPETPVNEIRSLSLDIARLASETASLLERFFERPLRPRSKAELEADLARILPETQLRDLDLDHETVASLAARELFTVEDVKALHPTELRELRSVLQGEALKVVQTAVRSLGNGSSTDDEGWSKLSPRPRKVLEEAGYTDLASLADATRAEIKALPGLGNKAMDALEEQMESAGVTFRAERKSAPDPAAAASGGSPDEPTRSRGTVRMFNAERGFGFIEWSGGKDLFVHVRAIDTPGYLSLSTGQQVEFEVTHGPKGPQAHHVQVV